MKCNEAKENLIELLTPGQASPEVSAHVQQCSACAAEVEELRNTMAVLDEWEAPEASPYFMTRMRAHLKEEREKAPVSSGFLAWLRRPVLAVSLATVLAAGGVGYRLLHVVDQGPVPGRALADVEALDKYHDVIVNTDLLDELSGGPSDDVTDN